MWQCNLFASVALSHLVLNIHTFHDTVYLHFHHVSLRKKNKIQRETFYKEKAASILKEYTYQRILFSMDIQIDRGWKESDC